MERKNREAKPTANSVGHSSVPTKDQGKAESGSNHTVLLKECPAPPGLGNQVCKQDEAVLLWSGAMLSGLLERMM